MADAIASSETLHVEEEERGELRRHFSLDNVDLIPEWSRWCVPYPWTAKSEIRNDAIPNKEGMESRRRSTAETELLSNSQDTNTLAYSKDHTDYQLQ